MEEISVRFRIALQYVIGFTLSVLIFLYVTKSFNHNLSIPYRYDVDALFAASWFKSFIDTGWYLHNPFIGAPNGYDLSYFPMADNFHFLIVKILSYISADYAVVLNLFFILTFPLATLSAIFVFKKLGLAYPFALVASILFAMLPYHFLHGISHIFLSSYYIVPLVAWASIFLINSKTEATLSKNKKTYVGIILLSILIGSSGIYYAFFGAFFFILSACIAATIRREWLPIPKAILMAVLITTTAFINFLPYYIANAKSPDQSFIMLRAPRGSERYGLKITPLLLPVQGSHIQKFSDLRANYDSTSPSNAGLTGALGIIGSLGFIMLLATVFIGKKKTDDSLSPINQIANLNLAAVLFATMGGFGTLFAYTISPMIRCYDRMSIYIGFFALFGFFYFCQKFIEHKTSKYRKYIIWCVALFTLVFGIYDQSSIYFEFGNTSKAIKAEIHNDKKFVQRIESKLPADSMVFQLPYTPFPEVNYDHFKPYLYSHHLRWSFGAMCAQPTDIWQRKLSNMSVPNMIENLIKAGFKAIYIDRNRYADYGSDIEKKIASVVGQQPMVSDDLKLSFFDLRGFQQSFKNNRKDI